MCFVVANKLPTLLLPLAPHSKVDEFSRIMAAETLKNLYFWQTVTFKLCQMGKKTNVRKKNRKLRILELWYLHFLWPRTKIDGWKICHGPILAVIKGSLNLFQHILSYDVIMQPLTPMIIQRKSSHFTTPLSFGHSLMLLWS